MSRNRHPFRHTAGPYAGTCPPKERSTGWPEQDAVIQLKCMHCGCYPGYHCQEPSGALHWPPHATRLLRLEQAPKPPVSEEAEGRNPSKGQTIRYVLSL